MKTFLRSRRYLSASCGLEDVCQLPGGIAPPDASITTNLLKVRPRIWDDIFHRLIVIGLLRATQRSGVPRLVNVPERSPLLRGEVCLQWYEGAAACFACFEEALLFLCLLQARAPAVRLLHNMGYWNMKFCLEAVTQAWVRKGRGQP